VYLETFGGLGADDVKVGHVTDVVADEQGRVYAPNWRNHGVTVLDHDGRLLASWGDEGMEAGQLFQPVGVALDGQGNIYVSDGGGRLQKFRLAPLPALAPAPAT
jgi:hypothetical protein